MKKVLIANRGEVACRAIRTLKRLGIRSVSIYSSEDVSSLHVLAADEAYPLGVGGASETYLDTEKVLGIAARCGADAVFPGYGFLSENADFADACAARQLAFIGPTSDQMRKFGLKHTARELASRSGIQLLPGTELLANLEDARAAATRVGYPVMLKGTAGGGGIGLALCENEKQLAERFESTVRLSENNFSQGGVFLEKFVVNARHVEVQIFGDGKGNVATLGERDCSAQRRNQKVIEETPAPGLPLETQQRLALAAHRLATSVAYRSAGTVEFIFDIDSGELLSRGQHAPTGRTRDHRAGQRGRLGRVDAAYRNGHAA